MMAARLLTWLFCLPILFKTCFGTDDLGFVRSEPEKKQVECPFVYGSRMPSAQDGLINCTWYSSNTCCKRTEVTSVFSSMLPLYTPDDMDPKMAKTCRNMINYMMCYFCDPNQANFYTSKLQICEDFCTDVYANCTKASYHGETIGTKFKSGKEFCEAQEFEIVSGTTNCFSFNASVFDAASVLSRSFTLFAGGLVMLFVIV